MPHPILRGREANQTVTKFNIRDFIDTDVPEGFQPDPELTDYRLTSTTEVGRAFQYATARRLETVARVPFGECVTDDCDLPQADHIVVAIKAILAGGVTDGLANAYDEGIKEDSEEAVGSEVLEAFLLLESAMKVGIRLFGVLAMASMQAAVEDPAWAESLLAKWNRAKSSLKFSGEISSDSAMLDNLPAWLRRYLG